MADTYNTYTPAGGPGTYGYNSSQQALMDKARAYRDAGVRGNPIKQQKQWALADRLTLTTDPAKFGLTDAQKRDMQAQASQQAGAQAQGQVTELARNALAGQGFQQDAFQSGIQAASQQTEDASVQAGAAANQLSQGMVEREKARILEQTNMLADQKRETDQFWANWGIDAVASVVSAAKLF